MYIVLCVYYRKVWQASGIMLKKAFVQSGRSNYSKKPILDKKILDGSKQTYIYFHNNSNGWILLTVKTMPKILRYLIMSKFLLSNVRFSALFRCLEESTQYYNFILYVLLFGICFLHEI